MNPFEQVAEAQRHAASKAAERAKDRRLAKLEVKSERDAPMVASPAEKAQYERQQLLKHFNKQMTERRRDLLSGRHGVDVKGLLQILDSLADDSAPALFAYLAKCGWFASADYNTRFDILWLIDTCIVRFRVRAGLAPFDDALPGEPPTVFLTVRKQMTGVGHD